MDPAQMTDEELQNAISQTQNEEPAVQEEAPVASPQEETAAAPDGESAENEAPAPETTPEAPAEEEVKAPSRREQLRVQQLLKKYGPPQETPTPPPAAVPAAPSPDRPDYRQMLEAEPELYDQLDKTTEQYGQAEYQRGTTDAMKQLQTTEWRTILRVESPIVESKFPMLDKNSPEFHPAVADTMNRRYLQMVGYNPQTGLVENPNISYRDFIESEFEFYEELSTTRNSETAKNLASQAAQTGLRPNGSSAKGLDLNKAPEDMTKEELNAVINASLPRDSRGRFASR